MTVKSIVFDELGWLLIGIFYRFGIHCCVHSVGNLSLGKCFLFGTFLVLFYVYFYLK